MEPNSCSTRVKKLIKVCLSEGESIQFDFVLRGNWFSANAVAKKVLFQHACFKFASGFIYSLLESFGEVRTKDKPSMRTENSSSVKVGWRGYASCFCCIGRCMF